MTDLEMEDKTDDDIEGPPSKRKVIEDDNALENIEEQSEEDNNRKSETIKVQNQQMLFHSSLVITKLKCPSAIMKSPRTDDNQTDEDKINIVESDILDHFMKDNLFDEEVNSPPRKNKTEQDASKNVDLEDENHKEIDLNVHPSLKNTRPNEDVVKKIQPRTAIKQAEIDTQPHAKRSSMSDGINRILRSMSTLQKRIDNLETSVEANFKRLNERMIAMESNIAEIANKDSGNYEMDDEDDSE